MKTQLTIITAVVLTAFAGISLAEPAAPIQKPVSAQAPAESAGQKAVVDTAKGVKAGEGAAAKESDLGTPAAPKEAQDTAKQPSKDIVATEAKPSAKSAEEGSAKIHRNGKEAEGTAKATKHSAEKGIGKEK